MKNMSLFIKIIPVPYPRRTNYEQPMSKRYTCTGNSFAHTTHLWLQTYTHHRGVARIWQGGVRIFFSDLETCMSRSDMLRIAKP